MAGMEPVVLREMRLLVGMKMVMKIPDWLSFVSEKVSKRWNENGTNRKWYGNGKSCSETEAEMIQHFYHWMRIPTVFSRNFPSEFRIRFISLGELAWKSNCTAAAAVSPAPHNCSLDSPREWPTTDCWRLRCADLAPVRTGCRVRRAWQRTGDGHRSS